MDDFENKILDLINSRKEGDFWDFKENHHENTADLILDILCLANSTRSSGDRYLIYGVKDKIFDVVGVREEGRKTQSDIIHTLHRVQFAGGVRPEISLKTFSVENKTLDVIVVGDRPYKPYYLEKQHADGKRHLRQGSIYTRVGDSNTPIDSTAGVAEVEAMWRERFGLSQNPLKRISLYMGLRDQWEMVKENYWYFKPFPEFTISKDESQEVYQVVAGEQWVRAATNPESHVIRFSLRYHQTPLYYKNCLYYDEMRCLAPEASVDHLGQGWQGNYFFSFNADSLDFTLLTFLQERSPEDLLYSGLFDGRGIKMPMLLFKSEQEKQLFKADVKARGLAVVPNANKVLTRRSGRVDEDTLAALAYGYGALTLLQQWRREQELGDEAPIPENQSR